MREAVGRCPSCQGFFCRECVTEHEGRLICNACLATAAEAARKRRVPTGTLLWPAAAIGGLLFAWIVFYYAGLSLSKIPSTFHTGGGQ